MKHLTLVLVIILLSVFVTAQWDDCPFGEVNDTYPGDCSRYVDTDKDDICDRSQPPPDERGVTTNSDLDGGSQLNELSDESKTSILMNRYDTIPISLVMILLFILTELALKRGYVSVIMTKYVWNVILAATFFITLFASLPSIFPLIKLSIPYLMLHVKAGIVMAWIVLYHTWGRRHFYTRCFPQKKNKCD